MLAKWNPLADGRIATSAWLMPIFDELERPAFKAGADVQDTNEALTLQLDLPGHDPKDVDIQIEGDVLTVKSQRRLRSGATQAYARSFVLPHTVDTTRCEAGYEHGVLTLTLPKREEAKPRSITVKVNR